MTIVLDSNVVVALVLDSHRGPTVERRLRELQRESAYDASYIALAQELDAELWTLDGPLARNASEIDLPVRLIDVG